MPLNKAYRDTDIPSWCCSNTATKEQLIDHIKYLTHTLETERKAKRKYRHKYSKLKKEVENINTV